MPPSRDKPPRAPASPRTARTARTAGPPDAPRAPRAHRASLATSVAAGTITPDAGLMDAVMAQETLSSSPFGASTPDIVFGAEASSNAFLEPSSFTPVSSSRGASPLANTDLPDGLDAATNDAHHTQATDSQLAPSAFLANDGDAQLGSAVSSDPTHPPLEAGKMPEIVLIDSDEDNDVRNAAVGNESLQGWDANAPPAKRLKPSPDTNAGCIINVDDDDELELLAQQTAHQKAAHTKRRRGAYAEAMAPAFAEPNRLFVARGGGIIKTIDENTLEIVDSDDEDAMTNDNLIVNDAAGMTTLLPNSSPALPADANRKSSALGKLAAQTAQQGSGTLPTVDTSRASSLGAKTPAMNAYGSIASVPYADGSMPFDNLQVAPIPFANSHLTHVPIPTPGYFPHATLTPSSAQMSDAPGSMPDLHMLQVPPGSAQMNNTSVPLAGMPALSADAPIPLMPNAIPMSALPFSMSSASVPMVTPSGELLPTLHGQQLSSSYNAGANHGPLAHVPLAKFEGMQAPRNGYLTQDDEVVPVAVTPSRTDNDGGAGMSQEGLRTLFKQNALSADATEEAKSPAELTVTLMPHQRRGLAWMEKREKPIHSDDDVIATDDECLGGILADDQGLGKTLTMIALMVKSPPTSLRGSLPDESTDEERDSDSDFIDDGVSDVEQKSVPWRTLIICPLSLISQWKDEIRTRIRRRHRPSICVYHGPRRERNLSVLGKFDIVITTYATLANEYPKVLKDHPEFEMRKSQKLDLPRRTAGPLCKMSWYRVVLDEAQYVKNRSTDSWGAVMSLKADKRWCLTGTPIQNNVDDLYALFCFVRYRCVPDYQTWNVRWKKPLESSNPQRLERIFKRFQTIVGVALLRRTKRDQIDGKPLISLPARVPEVYEEKFADEEEEAMYRAVQMKTVVSVNKFLVDGTLAMNYSSVLLLLLRLRQACSHPFLIQYARMQGRRWAGATMDDKYSTPYSQEDLEEALELVAGGHSLLDMIEEQVRETTSKLLEPTLKGQPTALLFLCAHCKVANAWTDGSSLLCGHFFCKNCAGLIRQQRRCLSCHYMLPSEDDLEMFVDLADLRKEVHARYVLGARGGQIEGITAGEFKALVRVELRRRRAEAWNTENGIEQPSSDGNAVEQEVTGGAGVKLENGKVDGGMHVKSESRVHIEANEITAVTEQGGKSVAKVENGVVGTEEVSQQWREVGSPKGAERVAGQVKFEKPGDAEGSEGRSMPEVESRAQTEWKAAEENSEIESLSEIPIGQWRQRGESSEETKESSVSLGENSESRDGSSGGYSSSDEPIARLPRLRRVCNSKKGQKLTRSEALANTEREMATKMAKSEKPLTQRTRSKGKKVGRKPPRWSKKEEEKVLCNMPEEQKRKLLDAFSQHSTKIRLIIDELNNVRKKNDREKTLIFSQWTSMLDIIEFHVQVNGHEVCRLDGSMTLSARQLQIEEFKESKFKNVFLISLHAGGTGLNLTAASRVILADVWWNPAVEEQAIDRVHRIGQTFDVHVSRFKMTGTVEERIYKICERKRQLVDGALGTTGAQSLGRQKLSMAELMFLFGSAAEDVARTAGEGTAAAEAASNILNYQRFA